jgi:hypothetical protein
MIVDRNTNCLAVKLGYWRLVFDHFLKRTGRYRSGQTGQTVNLLAYAFAGSNPALPILRSSLALGAS